MPKYIDADKIEYKMVAYPACDFSTGMVRTKYLEGEYAKREDIEYLPTADVAEVVRCKDCKYYQENNDGYPHEMCKWNGNETPDADDYCSCGERRTDNAEIHKR